MRKFFSRVWKGIKEFFRKFIVSLKRRPSIIATVCVLACLLTYTLSMTAFSNTTAYVNAKNTGLASFAVNLCSILSFISILNAFPKRKKPRVLMVVILFVLIAIMALCDVFYISQLNAAMTRPNAPIVIDAEHLYIRTAINTSYWHLGLLGLAVLSIVLMPVYGKLLRKINTDVAEDELIDENNVAPIALAEDEK